MTFGKAVLFLLALVIFHSFAACGSKQAHDEEQSSVVTAHDGNVDNSTFASDALFYTVSYDDDNGNEFDFILGSLLDETNDSFLSELELEVINCAKYFDIELETDFIHFVSVDRITDEKLIEKLRRN